MLVHRAAIAAALLASFGAGCTPISTTRVAEPFVSFSAQTDIAPELGFGTLPKLPFQDGSPSSTSYAFALPTMPDKITVLRLKPGTPNENEARNILAALQVPQGVVNDLPKTEELTTTWTDSQGLRWTYTATKRQLEFTHPQEKAAALTISALPSNDLIIETANGFLKNLAIDMSGYGSARVQPDWNDWWKNAQAENACMNASSLTLMRQIGREDPNIIRYPELPQAANTTCVSPEFPARTTVFYHRSVDGLDASMPDGTPLPGAVLVIDMANRQITGGKIYLSSNPERSDYPAIDKEELQKRLRRGGLSGSRAETLQLLSYEIGSVLVGSYLIPSLIVQSKATDADGTVTNRPIVVPLLKE